VKYIRGINLSLAVFVAVCFFLPWVQVSCGGVNDAESGFDLARHGTKMLWLVPLLMVIVFALGLGRDWTRRILSFGLASLSGGVTAAILIYRQRVDSTAVAGLLTARMTAWFWLSFAAAIVIAVLGLVVTIRRPPKGAIGS
jgi:bacteriorhodopsin